MLSLVYFSSLFVYDNHILLPFLCDALIHTSHYYSLSFPAFPAPSTRRVRPWLALKSRLYTQSGLYYYRRFFSLHYAWVGVSSTKSSCISEKKIAVIAILNQLFDLTE